MLNLQPTAPSVDGRLVCLMKQYFQWEIWFTNSRVGAQNDIFSSSSSSASSDSCSAVEKRESKRSFSHPLGRFARHVAEVLDDYNL